MLRSRANTLVSVRQVTERNAGRLTAGVDGEVVLPPEAKMRLVDRSSGSLSRSTRCRWRVYIRPGTSPSADHRDSRDRRQVPSARVVNALEPEWEARFEPRSYGFRPGRGCRTRSRPFTRPLKGKSSKRLWALDADLASAFDLIAHDHIQSMIGTFPARGIIRPWLKVRVVEQGRLIALRTVFLRAVWLVRCC